MLQQNTIIPVIQIAFTAAILTTFIFPHYGIAQPTGGEARPQGTQTDARLENGVEAGEESDNVSEADLQQKALQTGKMYAKSVSIHVVDYTVHMVRLTPIRAAKSTPEVIEYIFLWSGVFEDGPLRINYALVRQRPKGATYVDVKRSAPIVDLKLPAMWMEQIVDHSSNSVTVVGHRREEISDTDAYDKRIYVEFTLTLTDQGDWRASEGRRIRSEKVKRVVE